MADQRLILDSPEAVEIAKQLFPASVTVCYANGHIPEEWHSGPDVIVFGRNPDWVSDSAMQLVDAQCPRVRLGRGDIADIDRAKPTEWLRDRIQPYTPNPAPQAEPLPAPPPFRVGEPPAEAGLSGSDLSDFDGSGHQDEDEAAETLLRSIRNASALKSAEHEAATGEWPEPADFWQSRPLPAFDPDWIIPCVRPFIINQAGMVGCDPGITWLQALAFAAGCLSDDIRVRVRPAQDWAESARLWACIVGDSGDGKSPSMRGIMREASQLSTEIAQRSKDRHAGYKDELELHEMERKAWLTKRQKGDPAGPRPIAPAKPINEMLYFNSTTSEGLLEQQEATTRGTMLYADEMLGWILGMDQYKSGGKGSDRQFWLSSWDGAEFIGILVGRLRTIPNTGCTIIGGSQPNAIRAAAVKLNLDADGLMQRVLVYNSAGDARDDAEQIADRDAIRAWRKILHGLYAMKTHLDHCVFSDRAHAIRREADAWISKMRAVTTLPASARQALSKWRAYLPRIALTLHAIEAADAGYEVIPATIEEHSIATAWAYMRDCLWPHLLHFYTGLEDHGDDSRAVRSFAEYVLARDLRSVKPHFLASNWAYYRKNLKTIAQRREFFALAEQMGWVRPIGQLDRNKGVFSEYAVNSLAFDGRYQSVAEQARIARDLYREAMHPAMGHRREPGQD